VNDSMNNTGIKAGFTELWSIDIGDWSLSLGDPVILMASALLFVSLLLTLHACWRRLYPVNPSRAVMVAILNLVAFTTVLVILIEPQRLHLVEQAVVLVTEGTDMTTVSLIDGSDVYVSPGIVTTTDPPQHLKNANWLLDIAQLQLREPALASIDVRGFGLSDTQWQNLPSDIRIDFKAPSINGFTRMHWTRTMVAGETLRIGGRYSNQADKTILTLRLLNPAGSMVDETRSRNEAYFSLSARPRARGNLVYTLQAWSGETLLSEQAVTTSVGTTAAINIMVEQSAPSFETRQLRNYAAGNGAKVLINTQISRGKSISQSANLPDDAEITFSPQSLAVQDLLIMDGRALVLLADQQRQWLADAAADGLGLLVLADTSLLEEFEKLNNGILAGFDLASNPDAQVEIVPRLLSNPASDWQQALPVAAMQLQATNADILIDDGLSRALVLNKSMGLGYVAISLITQSHRWLTAGNRDLWSDYWAGLIAAIARPRSKSYLLPQAGHVYLRVSERAPVCALSTGENLIVTIIPTATDSMQRPFDIPLSADTLGSPRQCGWFWPQHSGWHQLLLRTESSGPVLDQQGIYIFNQHQWIAQSRYERSAVTQMRASQNTAQQIQSGAEKRLSEPLDVFWLYLLLVTSASLLWLERKQFYFQ